MMKQFLFEQLSNSVQNTTNKLLTHLEDNQKIISLLDNLLNSLVNTQITSTQIQQAQDDIVKISEFVSEILGTLDSCLFTLEYNTQKYVQHLSKKKDDMQPSSNLNNMDIQNLQNSRAQENLQMRNSMYMGVYNNMKSQPLYQYQEQDQYDHAENEEDYSQNMEYQQISNGFNGIEGDDEEDMYDENENDKIYLEENEYDEDEDQQQNQMYYQQQQYKSLQNNQQQQPYTKKIKFSKLIESESQQQATLNSNQNNISQSNKTKTISNHLTVNDIFN